MDKINWCCLQRDGINLVESNENLAKKYLESAESDFNEMKNSNSLKWKDITAYYSCYNSFYALLQKIGIKCEIHDCTIELLRFLIHEFGGKMLPMDFEFLKELKKTRVDAQYYLKEPASIDGKRIINFMLTCKDIYNHISFDEIQKIRKKIGDLIKELKNLQSTK